MTLSWRTGLRKRLLLSFYSLNQLQQSGSLRRKGVARNTQKREHNQHSGFISNNSQNKTIKKTNEKNSSIVSLPQFGGVWKINISWARVRIEYNGQDSPELFLSFCIYHPTTIQFWLSWLDPQQLKKGRQYSTHWFGVYLTYII